VGAQGIAFHTKECYAGPLEDVANVIKVVELNKEKMKKTKDM
jgi:hypothetical protein